MSFLFVCHSWQKDLCQPNRCNGFEINQNQRAEVYGFNDYHNERGGIYYKFNAILFNNFKIAKILPKKYMNKNYNR